MKKKILMILGIALLALTMSFCEKKEISSECTDCQTTTFSYLDLQKVITDAGPNLTYEDRVGVINKYFQDTKGRMTVLVKDLAHERYIVCNTYGCPQYGKSYGYHPCITCDGIKVYWGGCPYCAIIGLCSDEGDCYTK